MAGLTAVGGATARDGVESGGVASRLESAADEEVRAYREYAHDESMVERAFDEHIDAIARKMESSDVSAPSSLDEAEKVQVFPATRDGTASAHVVARFDAEEEIIFHLYPQANRGYADVGNGAQKLRFDPLGDVQPMGCYYEYECECPSACGYYMGYETTYNVCEYPDGTVTRERIGSHCGCDDAPNPCHG